MIRYVAVPIFALMTTPVLADADPNRRTDLISADLNILEQVFKACFLDVQPDGDKRPSGARQRMNKSILLPCLQAANPAINNDLLDAVMGKYRPEGPSRN